MTRIKLLVNRKFSAQQSSFLYTFPIQKHNNQKNETMKKTVLLSLILALLLGCNKNPNKEERIQKLEIELKKSSEKINELEQKIELKQTTTNNKKENDMNLGAFSVSLSVKDIKVSKAFYENLGFVQLGGDLDQNYLIMKNENSVIGLFQGMFEGNYFDLYSRLGRKWKRDRKFLSTLEKFSKN